MDKGRAPRRRDNKVYGSAWLDSRWPDVPPILWIAPAIVMVVGAIGCFGLAFLGWGV